MGTHCPLILISAGELADKYTSDAFFSLIKRRMRSMVPDGFVVAIVQPRFKEQKKSIAQQVVQ
jgi:hypothetical protein